MPKVEFEDPASSNDKLNRGGNGWKDPLLEDDDFGSDAGGAHGGGIEGDSDVASTAYELEDSMSESASGSESSEGESAAEGRGGRDGRKTKKKFLTDHFDLLAEEEDARDPYEKVRKTTVDLNIPPPSSTATKVKAKVAEASYLSEKINQTRSIYDSEIFYMCLRYHEMHKKEHTALKKAHRKREEQLLGQLPFTTLVGVILDDPSKSFIGRVFAAFEFFLVFVTILQLGMETLPATNPNIRPEWYSFWWNLEMGITIFFTLETLIRFAVTKPKKVFVKSLYNWLDILAVLPFYVELAGASGFEFLKILRTARFVKLMRNFRHIDALLVTIRKISRSLIAPAMFLCLSVLVISSALYFSEEGTFNRSEPPDYLQGVVLPTVPNNSALILPTQVRKFELIRNISTLLALSMNATEFEMLPEDAQRFVIGVKKNSTANKFMMEDCFCTSTASYIFGDRQCPEAPSRFPTITAAMFFTIVSMTTVGYGSVVPRCAPGKLIASAGLFASTVFLAMPIAIVGVSFMESVEEAKGREVERKRENRRNIRKLRVEAEMGNRKIKAKGMVKGMSDALKSGVGMLRKSFRHSNESLADQKTRRRYERLKRQQKEQELRNLENEQRSATAAESLLLHLATALNCRYFNFSTRGGAMDDLYPPNTPQPLMTSNGKPISYGSLSTSVVHHIDAFLSLLFESWVQQWFADHRQKLLGDEGGDEIGAKKGEGGNEGDTTIKGLLAAKKKASAADRLFAAKVKQAPRSVDRAVAAFLGEQKKVVQLLHSSPTWFNRLSLMEVVTSKPEGDVSRTHDLRGVARNMTFSRLVEYRVIATNNLSTSTGREKSNVVGSAKDKRDTTGVEAGHGSLVATGTAADDDEDVLLRINAPDFILPHTIAKIQILNGFLSRSVRLVVCSPWSYQVLVNGELIQPDFHARRVPNVAPTVEEWDPETDASEIRWEPTIEGGEMEDIFCKVLKDGDIINFTPIIRVPKTSYTTFRPERPSSSTTSGGKGGKPAGSPTSQPSNLDLLSSAERAAKHFESMGLVPVVYKVNFQTDGSLNLLKQRNAGPSHPTASTPAGSSTGVPRSGGAAVPLPFSHNAIYSALQDTLDTDDAVAVPGALTSSTALPSSAATPTTAGQTQPDRVSGRVGRGSMKDNSRRPNIVL